MQALLVEDSLIFAESLHELLAQSGNTEIRLAHVDRLALVTSALDPMPDVVLLDLFLPDAEGIDSIRGVQKRLPGVPIVVLTADSNEEQALQMVRGGAQDYLVKGRFNVDTLVRAMRYAIERVQGEQLKRQLLQADRLAAVGRLAAGVAHEISNPATFVQASAGLLDRQMRIAQTVLQQMSHDLAAPPVDHEALARSVGQVLRALAEVRRLTEQNAAGVDRICSVVQDLRGYSRLEPGKVVRVHPNEVVSDVCNLVSNVVRHKARLVKNLVSVPPVALPRGRLDQILTNLLVNAAQAIPDAPPEENSVTIDTFRRGEEVVVSVEDTGPGMTPDQQKKVFEPFFTTKPRGVGTGLGLSICQEIARAHGGDVHCSSEVGHGTRFEVRFPAVLEPDVRMPTPAPAAPVSPEGRARILLVDDEPHLREVYKILLQEEFDVETVGDGRKALELIQQPSGFDVIVCDVMMPDMDAAQLLEAITQIDPALSDRFILYTGGAVSDRARRLVDSGEIPVLYKPLLTDELKAVIRSRLAGD